MLQKGCDEIMLGLLIKAGNYIGIVELIAGIKDVEDNKIDYFEVIKATKESRSLDEILEIPLYDEK